MTLRVLRGVIVATSLLVATVAGAGTYNPALNIGDAAPAWKDLPGTDGKSHSLADLAGKDVVVVVFTCNSCPVAGDYEERIMAFAKKYAAAESRVALVAINVNKVDEDKLPKMKERAEARGFTFPYLYDESQQIAKDFGAVFTPEFFVLDKPSAGDGGRRVVYMGGMDDSSIARDVKTNYLVPAVEAALAGKTPETAEAPAIGCGIRFERARRGRAN